MACPYEAPYNPVQGIRNARQGSFCCSPRLIVLIPPASGSAWGEQVKTILVVEDDPSILALIRFVLIGDGYSVSEAASAEQAFERFEEHDAQVDLLIADVTLPVGSGIQVALELRSLLPFLKIIITSGFPKAMWDDQKSKELDDLPYDSVVILQKPFVPATLLESIHQLIGLPYPVAPALKMKVAS